MITLRNLKEQMESDAKNGLIYLMDFVDDFRYYKNPDVLREPFSLNRRDDACGGNDPGGRDDAGGGNTGRLLASVAEYLCDEMDIPCPEWIRNIPACKDPWFVSGIENLKAISLVESPLQFRIRKIFVLENFLSRV